MEAIGIIPLIEPGSGQQHSIDASAQDCECVDCECQDCNCDCYDCVAGD